MRAVGFIPARAGSKGLPDKNALTVAGVPVVVRAIQAVRSAGPDVGKILVSTDSPAVARLAMESGAFVVERPKELAGDAAGVESAARHALRAVYGPDGPFPEATLVVQPNLPVWQPGIVARCLERLARGDCTTAATCHLVEERPEWMKKLSPEGYAVPFMEFKGPVPVWRQAFPELYFIDGAVLAVRTDVLMASEGRPVSAHYYLGDKIAPVVRPEIYGVELHSAADLARAELTIAWLEKAGYPQ
jgi:CMP-N-acetylneuraminic acid synthetase